LQRKEAKGETVEPTQLLKSVTDLAGVRVLHLYQAQFAQIHTVIQTQIDRGDWCLHEDPVAYTWDPESSDFFKNLGLQTKVKESFYTSIHYVLKPRADSPLCCELQVRTLFEEAWGEIDHGINYPRPTSTLTCREQLRVLSKLVGAATRLADSIFRSHNDDLAKPEQ
jgi:ppGpp synthetase/RelA/SpoT-type nucleotidyltranferase